MIQDPEVAGPIDETRPAVRQPARDRPGQENRDIEIVDTMPQEDGISDLFDPKSPRTRHQLQIAPDAARALTKSLSEWFEDEGGRLDFVQNLSSRLGNQGEYSNQVTFGQVLQAKACRRRKQRHEAGKIAKQMQTHPLAPGDLPQHPRIVDRSHAADDRRNHDLELQPMRYRQRVGAASGEPNDSKSGQPKLVHQLGHVVGPVNERAPGGRGRTPNAGPFRTDQPQSQSARRHVRKGEGQPRAGDTVKRQHRKAARIPEFGNPKDSAVAEPKFPRPAGEPVLDSSVSTNVECHLPCPTRRI